MLTVYKIMCSTTLCLHRSIGEKNGKTQRVQREWKEEKEQQRKYACDKVK